MMVKRLLLIVILLTISSFSLLADTDLGFSCTEDAECSFYAEDPSQMYCNLDTGTCFFREESSPPPSDQPINDSAFPETIPDNTSNITTTPPPSEPGVNALLEQNVGSLRGEVSVLQNITLSTNTQVSSLQAQIAALQQLVSTLQSSVEGVTVQQNSADSQINQLSTGLAGLQENVQTTQTELDAVEDALAKRRLVTTILMYSFIALLIIAVSVGLTYYMTGSRKTSFSSPKNVSTEIAQYITHHIKKGKKFPEIKQTLLKAGWSEQDIQWAYEETTKQNYQQYLKTSSSSSNATPHKSKSLPDRTKILTLVIFSILVLLGLLLLLRGVTTGQAIHFGSNQELNIATEDLLQKYVVSSELFSLVNDASLCIEVHDNEKQVSYKMIKSSSGTTLDIASKACSADPTYSAAVVFTNWNSFNVAARRMTCEALQGVHKMDTKTNLRGMYILPSRYVLPGFKLNPALDVTSYCSVLSQCLSKDQIKALKITC